jgi:hypothetical protein
LKTIFLIKFFFLFLKFLQYLLVWINNFFFLQLIFFSEFLKKYLIFWILKNYFYFWIFEKLFYFLNFWKIIFFFFFFYFRVTFIQFHILIIEFGTLYKKTIDIGSIFWFFSDFSIENLFIILKKNKKYKDKNIYEFNKWINFILFYFNLIYIYM